MFSFRATAGRIDFFIGTVAAVIISVLISMASAVDQIWNASRPTLSTLSLADAGGIGFTTLSTMLVFVYQWSLATRRLNDTGLVFGLAVAAPLVVPAAALYLLVNRNEAAALLMYLLFGICLFILPRNCLSVRLSRPTRPEVAVASPNPRFGIVPVQPEAAPDPWLTDAQVAKDNANPLRVRTDIEPTGAALKGPVPAIVGTRSVGSSGTEQ